jgi:hypothetical protein
MTLLVRAMCRNALLKQIMPYSGKGLEKTWEIRTQDEPVETSMPWYTKSGIYTFMTLGSNLERDDKPLTNLRTID